MSSFFPSTDGDRGWFRIGHVEITTTIILTALGTLSMFLWVISKELFVQPFVLRGTGFELQGSGGEVLLDYGGVRTGQVWRLATWPFVNQPDIWLAVSLLMLYMIGGDCERRMGRGRYLWMMGALTVVPAIVATIYPVDGVYGMSYLVSGLFVILVLMEPHARTFFNIPLWALVVVFVVISILQILDQQDWPTLVFFLSLLATAALAARAFDLTEFHQIPKVPLPAFVTGDPYQKANRNRERNQRKARRRGDNVVSIGQPSRPVDRMRQADIDALLDKISAQGIDSLTPEERKRLDEHSRHLRGE